MVQSFKAGPDYIDPLFHDTVLASEAYGLRIRNCENLDTYFAEPETVRDIYDRCSAGADISLIEGVMGLYDGAGGVSLRGSTYELAVCLGSPVIIAADAKGASGSLVAALRGFLDYDKAGIIRGVILNRCSGPVCEALSPVIEEELHIKALGYLPVLKDIHIDSRYLGLTLPNEIVDIKQQLGKLADRMSGCVDIDGIIEISRSKG